MIKRTAAVFFLLVAGIFLLVHAAVPHHHHGKLVCFVKSHCVSDDSADGQGKNHPGHGDDGDCSSDNCALKEPLIINSNQPASGFRFINKDSFQYADDNLQQGSLASETDNQLSVLPYSVVCFTTSFPDYTHPFSSTGLRSPPAV